MTAASNDAIEYGPALRELPPRQRAFVLALFDAPRKHGSGVFAARKAGYQGNANVLAVTACQLRSDERVRAAIDEVSRQFVSMLAPEAVRAMKKILDDPKHRELGRMIGLVLDRVAPAESTHKLKVEGEIKLGPVETEQVLKRIEELAAKFSVSLPAPKIIDGELA